MLRGQKIEPSKGRKTNCWIVWGGTVVTRITRMHALDGLNRGGHPEHPGTVRRVM
jgi:hypothetical protein